MMINKFKMYLLLTSAAFLFQINVGNAGINDKQEEEPRGSIAAKLQHDPQGKFEALIEKHPLLGELWKDFQTFETPAGTISCFLNDRLSELGEKLSQWRKDNGVKNFPDKDQDPCEIALSKAYNKVVSNLESEIFKFPCDDIRDPNFSTSELWKKIDEKFKKIEEFELAIAKLPSKKKNHVEKKIEQAFDQEYLEINILEAAQKLFKNGARIDKTFEAYTKIIVQTLPLNKNDEHLRNNNSFEKKISEILEENFEGLLK